MATQFAPSTGQTTVSLQSLHPQHSFSHSQQMGTNPPHSSASYQYQQPFPYTSQHMTEVYTSSLQNQQPKNHGQQAMQGHNGSMVPLNPQHRQSMTDPGMHAINPYSLGRHLAPDNKGDPFYAKSSLNPSLASGHEPSFSAQKTASSVQHQGKGDPNVPIHLPQNHSQGQSRMPRNAQNHTPNQHQQITHRSPKIPASQTVLVGSTPQHMMSNSKPLPRAGRSDANHEHRPQTQKNRQQISSTHPVVGRPALSGDAPQTTAHSSQQDSSNIALTLSVTSQPTSAPPGDTAAPK